MYSRWWKGKKEKGDKSLWKHVFKGMLSCIKYTVWTLVLVINVYQSQDDCSVSFYPLPYTVKSIVMTSPGECHSVMLGNHCLFGSQNGRELTAHPVLSNLRKSSKDIQMKQALVFSKPKKCKKSIEFIKGQKLSQKVIARIQILKTVIELHLYKD